MVAFIRYQLFSLIRSLKFIPPAVVFLIWIFILYAYKNVPILSSYAVSSIALYLVSTWLTMSMFSLEEESEKHILFSHLQRKVRYLFGKWLSLLLLVVPLLLFAILFPIITSSFKGSMNIGVCFFAIYNHVIFSALGILVGTFCSATKLAAKKYGWLSAVLVLVVSLSIKSLLEMTAYFKWITWVFPPVFKVIDHMGGGEVIQNQETLVSDGIFVSLYLLIGTLVLVYLFRKNES